MSANNNRFWKPSSKEEKHKLETSSGFNLAGSVPCSSRTRGVSLSYKHNDDEPTPKRPRVLLPSFLGNTGNTTISSLTTATDVPPTETKSRLLPPSTRIILEREPLQKQMESYVFCPKCKSNVTVSFPTTCIATGSKITCNNDMCSWINYQGPRTADVPLPQTHQGSALIVRNVDFEANVLFVLSFLTSGDGGVEAGRLCGMMGFPNSTTMGPRSFGIIEEYIGPVIRQFADDIVRDNLVAEVREYYGSQKDNDDVLLFDLWQQDKLPIGRTDLWPHLPVTYDMGWQGRASGMQCNSLSGDACFFGGKTRKAIGYIVVSKGCSFCNGWKKQTNHAGIDVPEHDCRRNWYGSSGAMEPHGCLQMSVRLYNNNKVITSTIVTDDDSSIKSKLKWSNKDHMANNGLTDPPTTINSNGNEVVRPDHGELPGHMPEPVFKADPNHRKKTWKKSLYQLLYSAKKVNMTITHMDVLRLGTNFAYMIRTLHGKTEEEMISSSKAVIEHHFDCHTWCGGWCSRKKQTQQQKDEKKRHYRTKEKDGALYNELQKRIERFITIEALREVAHEYDTLCNESFNNVAAWLAPKNKVYGASASLTNRVAVAVGVTSLGTLAYYQELFNRLGLTMSPVVEHYLRLQSQYRDARIAKGKTAEGKKNRVDKYHNRLMEKTVVAKREKAKREGTYKTGMGINGGYTEEELSKAQELYPKEFQQAARRQSNNKKAAKCPFCERPGHVTRRSAACGEHQLYLDNMNKKKQANGLPTAGPLDDNAEESDDVHRGIDTPAAQTARDSSECDILDGIDLDGNDEFFDCIECSDLNPEDNSNDSDKENAF